MTETATPKAKKAAPEVTVVQMEDGSSASFVGKRNINKIPSADGTSVRFEFRNGKVLNFPIPDSQKDRLAQHGAAQKIGDSASGIEDLDDAFEACQDTANQLTEGKFNATRSAGNSFAGTSVVVRALMEVTGKDKAAVTAFIAKQIAERGVSRAALYVAYRAPTSRVGQVIARLEAAKAKAPVINADDLGELGA